MRTRAVRILGTTFTLIGTTYAQTYTACDPTNVTCPPTPGLDSNYYFVDFTTVTSTPADWIVPTWCRVTYNTNGRKNGAEMEFLERYDSQQLYSSFYFLFGRVEFVVQAAPGPGIISDMMTLSDDLDELDWEFRGSLDDEVQTGWFGKGVTGLYNHSITPKIPTPMTQFHTYAFDWTPERVIWDDDGTVVRTLQASDCIGTANQYPQTPMKLMMGLWDAGDPDHYDPWAAGMTPVPPPEGGYSFYVKSVKIWNNNPATCYNWTDHSGSWQSIKGVNDSSACGISPKPSSTIVSSPSATSSETTLSSLATLFSKRITSSPSATSSTSATLSSQQLSADASTPLVLSLSASSMRLIYPTQLISTGASSNKVSYDQAFSSTKASSELESSTFASSTSSLAVQSPDARTSSVPLSSLHPPSSEPSNTQLPTTQTTSTQRWTTQPSSVLSLASVEEPSPLSAATPSTLLSSSTMSNAILPSSISAGQSPRSTTTTQLSFQISAIIQTISGKVSISSPTNVGTLTSSTAISLASSKTPSAISAQTGTSSKLVSSTAHIPVVVSSTRGVSSSPTAPRSFLVTTGSAKDSLLHTSAVPSQNTLTILVKLPGHQILSYNPIIGNLTELIYSLKRLMHAHRSKRDLAWTSPGPAELTSYSSFSGSIAHRFQHGHQHDHLHDPHRGRGLNSGHAVLTNNADPSMASGRFTVSLANAATTGYENLRATVAGTVGAASLSEQLIQSAASGKNAPLPAESRNLPHKGSTGRITVPQSLLEDQSTVSQATPAYSSTASTSKATANAETHSMLQQEFSTAGRVSLFGEMDSILRAMIFGLWILFFATMYH